MDCPGFALETSGAYATVAEYRAYLADYAKAHALFPERGTVLSVEQAGDVFELRIDTTAIRALVRRRGDGDVGFPPDCCLSTRATSREYTPATGRAWPLANRGEDPPRGRW